MTTQVAAQLILAEINLDFVCSVKKSKNLKTSHSVTVREGWVMSANLAGLRTLNLSDDDEDKKRL